MKRMNEYVPQYLGMNTDTARLAIQFIRNYDRFKEQADDLLALGVGIKTDSQPKPIGKGDPTAKTAVQRERVLDEVKIIEESLATLPDEYQEVVWRWVKDGIPLYKIEGSEYAADKTWYQQKKKFVTEVARRKGWL